MDIADIKQQMLERERFAPDIDEIRSAVLAGRTAPTTVHADPRRSRLLAGVAAGLVVLIALTVGLMRFLQSAQVAAPPNPPAAAATDWVGIRWNLVSVSQGGTTAEVTEVGLYVLQFAVDGTVSGSGNCYGSSGRWSALGRTLQVARLTELPRRCLLDPNGAQPAVIGKAVDSLTTVGVASGHVEHQTLTLQSGPYALTFHDVGPVVTYPSSSDPAFPSAPARSSATSVPSSATQTASVLGDLAPLPAAQRIIGATVYDPKGDGVKDNSDAAPLAVDAKPQTFWQTFVYKQQFPSALKPGVGLTLRFAAPITPTSVTVSSDTPGTIVEVRSATAPDLSYEQTFALARSSIPAGTKATPGTVTIPLVKAPKSSYLVVFVVQMGANGSRFSSDLNEISVRGE